MLRESHNKKSICVNYTTEETLVRQPTQNVVSEMYMPLLDKKCKLMTDEILMCVCVCVCVCGCVRSESDS